MMLQNQYLKPNRLFSAAETTLVGVVEMAEAIDRLMGGIGEKAAHVQILRALPALQQIVVIAAVRLLSKFTALTLSCTLNLDDL